MSRLTKISLLMLLGFIPRISEAQNATGSIAPAPFQAYWNIQLNGGITQYYGDLNKDNMYNKNVKGAFGGILGYQITPMLGTRGQFVKGNLYSKRNERKLNSDFWDASLQLTLNLNEVFAKYNPERKINFYLFGGAGLTSFTSTITNVGNGIGSDTSGSLQNEFFIPIGAGASFRILEKISLNLEYGNRVTFKDNTLDLIASAKGRDQYSYTSAGLTFRFGGPCDKDKDGVKDKIDLCKDIPGTIELSGCPDKDHDGIADYEDACPDEAGKLEFKGCPDSDKDGFPDKEDKCPNAAGKRELHGCPDKDEDGIADIEDNCPEMAGKKELAGCPDKDGDGIIDKDDACPELAGLTRFSGCPDKDNDGIPDNRDQCPDVMGAVDNNGCPVQSSLLVNEIVYFNTDEYIVIASYNQLLNKIAETMRDNPGIHLLVDGHTDSRESIDYNLRLSERRADYIIDFFTDRGIDPKRLIKGFYGKSRPVADNSTEEGMSLNRRVEIKSVK